jgi:uncharacterized membrane protein
LRRRNDDDSLMRDLVVLVWIVFSLLLAVVANSRGRSPVGWFLLSLLISPLIAFVLLLVMADLSVHYQRHDVLVEAISGSPANDDALSRLARLASLRDSGAITPAEYETKKAQLLERV